MKSKIKTNKVLQAGMGYTIGNYLLKGINLITLPIFARLMNKTDYPFDNVPTGIKRKVQLAKSSMLFLALNNWNRKKNFSGIKKLIISGLKMFPIESVWRMYEKNNTKYSGKKTEYVDTVALPSYAKQGIHFYKKTDVQQTVSHSYEFIDLNIPKGNDTCLRQQYGDYMELPPLEKRGTHHDFIVFYDPDRSYLEYKDSEILKKYFNGDISVELL